MAIILEAMPLGPAWRQRQHRVEPVESQNRRLLVQQKHGYVLLLDRQPSTTAIAAVIWGAEQHMQ
jgi:hypothetical protein